MQIHVLQKHLRRKQPLVHYIVHDRCKVAEHEYDAADVMGDFNLEKKQEKPITHTRHHHGL